MNHVFHLARLTMLLSIALLTACETAYYSAWEKIGVEKRDIMIDRIEEAQEAQEDGQEQFKDALEQFRSVVNYDGGNLEKVYDKLNGEYEDSVEAADDIKSRIESVDDVAGDLFAEWKKEIGEFSDAKLRRDSQAKLTSTKTQYAKLLKSMRSAEKTMNPVLATLKDQVLYLKHNLNARAIASLDSELQTINADVDRLVKAMQKSIDESKSFIAQMKDA
ncbi:MAG: DUF2959 domain-containing protein [Pseudomonadales bacterium]